MSLVFYYNRREKDEMEYRVNKLEEDLETKDHQIRELAKAVKYFKAKVPSEDERQAVTCLMQQLDAKEKQNKVTVHGQNWYPILIVLRGGKRWLSTHIVNINLLL